MFALLFVFAVSSPIFAADASGKGTPQTLCPILGGKIDKKVYVDYKGKRVYFCCASCKDDFNKDPDKYIKQMEDKGITLEKAPDAK
jgi:YHS domain-containing protein